MGLFNPVSDNVGHVTVLLARRFVVFRLRTVLLDSRQKFSNFINAQTFGSDMEQNPQSALLMLIFNSYLIRVLYCAEPWVEFSKAIPKEEGDFLESIRMEVSTFNEIKLRYVKEILEIDSIKDLSDFDRLVETIRLFTQSLSSMLTSKYNLDLSQIREFKYLMGFAIFCELQKIALEVADLLPKDFDLSLDEIAKYYYKVLSGLLCVVELLFESNLISQLAKLDHEIKSYLASPANFKKLLELLQDAHVQSISPIKETFEYNMFRRALIQLETEILSAIELVRSGIRLSNYVK